MSLRCLKCDEAWEFEDYQCPCCNGATVDAESDMEPTIEYITEPLTEKDKIENPGYSFKYDVVDIHTRESVMWKNDPSWLSMTLN